MSSHFTDDASSKDDPIALANIPFVIDISPLLTLKDDAIFCVSGCALDLPDDIASEDDPVTAADILLSINVSDFLAFED